MQKIVTATEAYTHFEEMIQHVTEHQETIIIEHDGQPKLVMISFAEYKRLQNMTRNQDALLENIRRVRAHVAEHVDDSETPAIEDIIRQMRDERYGQLPDFH